MRKMLFVAAMLTAVAAPAVLSPALAQPYYGPGGYGCCGYGMMGGYGPGYYGHGHMMGWGYAQDTQPYRATIAAAVCAGPSRHVATAITHRAGDRTKGQSKFVVGLRVRSTAVWPHLQSRLQVRRAPNLTARG